jgi:hypothetical protein
VQEWCCDPAQVTFSLHKTETHDRGIHDHEDFTTVFDIKVFVIMENPTQRWLVDSVVTVGSGEWLLWEFPLSL